MASSLWKFIKSKVAHPDKTKMSELLAFNRGAQHGFPECPTALAFDAELSLLAIGTGLGAVHVYGAPGVELSYNDDKQTAIKYLYFIPNTGRMVVVHEGGHLTLLELNTKEDVTVLENVKSLHSSKLENVSSGTVVATGGGHLLLAGTKDGQILAWTLPALEPLDTVSIRDSLTAKLESMETGIPAEKKTNPGTVVALAQQPNNGAQILVAFSTGIIGLYNLEGKVLDHVVYHEQVLTGATWMTCSPGSLTASFDDGSCLAFTMAGDQLAVGKSFSTYGPYPCAAIHKILVHSSGDSGLPVVIFSGGLPKDRFADHHVITITQGEKLSALDFPTTVVDFLVLEDGAVPSEPHALVVLLQNRLVVIDLTSDKLPEIVAPHLISLYAPVTSFELFDCVPADLLKDLEDAGKRPSDARPFGGYSPKYSQRQWPVHGGTALHQSDVTQHGLLITAHGDGCLRFWDASGSQLRFLHKLDAPSRYYHVESEPDTHDDTLDVWPPFRKYGFEEVAVSDPRLQVQKFAFDSATKTLAVGGKAGQVLVYQFSNEYAIVNFRTVKVSLVGEEYEYVWRGTQSLPHREGNLESFAGFQGVLNVQLDPPSEITALAIHADWKLLAVGTGHGFALIDYIHQRQVVSNTTLNPAEGAEAHETVQQKAKRAGDTLRRSLRRIPRPHLNIRSPTSYTFSSSPSCHENGLDGSSKKNGSKLIEEQEEGVELTGERKVVSPTGGVGVVNGVDVVNGTTTADELLVNGKENGHTEINTVTTDKVITETDKCTETTVTVTKETAHVIAAVPFLKTIELTPFKISEVTPEPSGSIIVDEAILESLEKDVMPPGLELEKEEDKADTVKPEKVYNYESTTVRTLHFSTSFLVNDLTQSSCLWAGLNNGTILAYIVEVPSGEAAAAGDSVKAVLSKEIHLRHGAPVIFIGILENIVKSAATSSSDATTSSVPASPVPPAAVVSAPTSPLPEESVSPPGSPGVTVTTPASSKVVFSSTGTSSHKLLVASEEQLKIFHLPSLKSFGKYKLSNARFKKVDLIQVGPLKEDYRVATLNTRGEVDVYSLPGLKRQLRAGLAKKDNLNVAFGRNGQGLYQSGTNELQRFFLTSGALHSVPCLITLPEGSRPVPPPPPADTPADVPVQEEQVKLAEETSTATAAVPVVLATQPLDGCCPTVETVELQESPAVVATVVVSQETSVFGVSEDGKIVVAGDGQLVDEVVSIQHTVQTVTFPDTDSGSHFGAGGDAETVSKSTLIIEEVTVDVERMNESGTGDYLLADISSDSIIHHDSKTNGHGGEESEHHVHSLQDKLKGLDLEETGSATTGHTQSY